MESSIQDTYMYIPWCVTKQISCEAKQKGTVKVHLQRAKANVKTFLPLAKEVWGKVMFLHLSVILFTEAGCVSQHAMGQTPSRHTPPWADTP